MDRTGGYAEYSFVSEFYDWIPPYQDRGDIKFYLDAARTYGDPILELACGTGRILIPLAREGFKISGMDLSQPMLARCREKLAAESENAQKNVELTIGDIRDFDLKKKFSLITVPFRAFLHLLTAEDQISALTSIHRHLIPGGHFILDIFNPSLQIITDDSLMEESGDETEFELPDGRRVCRRMRIDERDYLNQTSQCEQIYYISHPDGRKERLVHKFPIRYIFRYEAEHLLERTGFRVEKLYGDYESNIFGKGSSGELIYIAQKQA